MSGYVCSIIMPVYNGEKYICAAIDSVLAQKTTYSFEIIIINDGSTDATGEIIRNYAKLFNNIVLLENEKNHGKGYSFKRAYAKSRGRYFHVLDADDVFTNSKKLHKQIDFLENNADYTAVCHNTLLVYPGNKISITSTVFEEKTYSYEQCLLSKFYAHTSAIMYRKIVNELPEYFTLEPFRGDSAVFMFHILKSKGKVKYFPDIFSIYNWRGEGIWSSMDAINQKELNISFFSLTQKYMVGNNSSPEWQMLQKIIDWMKITPIENTPEKNIYVNEVIALCIQHCEQIFTDPIYFNAVFSSKLVDELAESIGHSIILNQGLCLSNQPFNDVAIIAVSGLSRGGGGIYNELKDLSKALLTKFSKLYIVSSSWIIASENDWHEAFSDPRIEVIQIDPSLNYIDKISALINIFYELRATVLYPFTTHLDIPLNAALQSGLAKTVIMDFVYDHSLILSLNNSSIDNFIVKNERQLNAINSSIPDAKFVICAPLLEDKFQENHYSPCKNANLTTASASARTYKTNSNYIYEFIDVIIAIMKETHGFHYHYGKLDEEALSYFHNKFTQANIDLDRFIHIEWAENLGQSMLDNGVDIFVATFPVCSARIAVEMMSAGIPILNHAVINPSMYLPADFCDPEQFLWSDMDNLIHIIRSIDIVNLKKKSSSARNWFMTHNNYISHIDKLVQEEGAHYPPIQNPLIHIYNYDTLRDDSLVQNIIKSLA